MERNIRTKEAVMVLSADQYKLLDIDLRLVKLEIASAKVKAPTLAYPVAVNPGDAAYFQLEIEETDSGLRITEVHNEEGRSHAGRGYGPLR